MIIRQDIGLPQQPPPKLLRDIPYGTVFSGAVSVGNGIKRGTFLRGMAGIINLSDWKVTGIAEGQHNAASVDGYREYPDATLDLHPGPVEDEIG